MQRWQKLQHVCKCFSICVFWITFTHIFQVSLCMFDLCLLMFAEGMPWCDIMNSMMTRKTMNTTSTTNTTNSINHPDIFISWHRFQWLCIKIGHWHWEPKQLVPILATIKRDMNTEGKKTLNMCQRDNTVRLLA